MKKQVAVPVWHHPPCIRTYRNYDLGFKIKDFVCPEFTEIRNKKERRTAGKRQGLSLTVARGEVGVVGAVLVVEVRMGGLVGRLVCG